MKTLDYFSELGQAAAREIPEPERILKRYPESIRRAASARLAELMRSRRPFSYIRLGDMELFLLLADQAGVEWNCTQARANLNPTNGVAWGLPGLDSKLMPRLRHSYATATYVDFQQRFWVNRALLPRLVLQRSPGALCNAGAEDSLIMLDWVRYEFKKYVTNRRCLLVGAEAGILSALFKRKDYRDIARDFWPENAVPFFLSEGYQLAERVEDVKKNLETAIKLHKIDTVFVSLGGAAKFLCTEIAWEFGVCAFDFGAAMRGLCYAGSDGHSHGRSPHNPFFFRVPFNSYMDAYEESAPTVLPEKLLVKAQCQVLLDAFKHEVGETSIRLTGMINDPERETFLDTLSLYHQRYGCLESANPSAQASAREFKSVCREILMKKNTASWWLQRIRRRIQHLLKNGE